MKSSAVPRPVPPVLHQRLLQGGVVLLAVVSPFGPSGTVSAANWIEALPGMGGVATGGQASVSGTAEVSATAPALPLIRESKQAVVRVLDKQTNRTQQLTLNVGQLQAINGVTYTLQRCLFDYQAKPGYDVVWLDVSDETMPEKGFSGWMYNRFSAAATLEHPRYDVQLVSCVVPQGQARLTTSSGSVVTPPPADQGSTGGGDDEAPTEGDAPTGGGNDARATTSVGHDASGSTDGRTPAIVRKPGSEDPFYVPGMGNDAESGDTPVNATNSAEERKEPAGGSVDEQELQRMMENGTAGE